MSILDFSVKGLLDKHIVPWKGVPRNIPLEYFSVLPNPPGDWLMGAFQVKSWVDNSGDAIDKQHKVCSIAGYIASAIKWRKFEKLWKQTLRRYKVPYLHMREFTPFKPPFHIFRDKRTGKEKPARKLFLEALINVMQDTQLQGIVSIVKLDDLSRFNQERNVNVNALALNLFTCMIFAGQLFPKTEKNKIIEMVIDKLEKPSLVIDKAKEYAKTDLLFSDDCKHIDVHPLHSDLTFKDVIPIQAADFLAWEARDDIDTKSGWWAKYKDVEDIKKLCEYDYNRFLYPRKSFENLMKSLPPEGMVWNYEWLIRLLDGINLLDGR